MNELSIIIIKFLFNLNSQINREMRWPYQKEKLQNQLQGKEGHTKNYQSRILFPVPIARN